MTEAGSLHVTFLIRSFGFPEGMAATNRVRLLGRALIEQGAEVRALCTRVTERPGYVRNADVEGVRDGIHFRYTTGTTMRSDSFLARRYREARGFCLALIELTRLRRRGSLDCVYFAALPEAWSPAMWVASRWLRLLHVPVVTELNELPATIAAPFPALSRRLSHLSGVQGAVAISAWLSDWVAAEARRLGRRVEVIEVPIVVDIGEQHVAEYPQGPPQLVYSASPAYASVATFLFRAMRIVWQAHPECRLTITGLPPQRLADLARGEGIAAAVSDGRLSFIGYVPRAELLMLYRHAAVLLIPLFDDLRSRARFPTKIGEYLAAARPVVTSNVGEIGRFLCDGETAYIANAGEVDAYAAKLLAVLDDPAQARAIGYAGRQVAEQRFHYALQGPRLAAFLSGLVHPSSATRRHTHP